MHQEISTRECKKLFKLKAGTGDVPNTQVLREENLSKHQNGVIEQIKFCIFRMVSIHFVPRS